MLLASSTILPGTLVVEEEPIVVGPNQRGPPLCLHCLHPTPSPTFCTSCGHPFCSPTCREEGEEGHREECKVLGRGRKREEGKVKGWEEGGAMAILPLRLLLWYLTHPKEAPLVRRLKTHAKEKVTRDYWPASQHHVVDFLVEECGEGRWSRGEVTEAVTILEVNGFEIENFNPGGFRGFYPYIASLTSHSCRPTCHSVVDSSPPYTNRLVASRRIEVGEELTTTYIPLTAGTASRRRLLCQGWCFTCTCPRCEDPSECGAHTGSLKCRKCAKGLLLPSTTSSSWSCSCGHFMEGQEVGRLVTCFMDTVRRQAVEKRYNIKGWTDLVKCASPIFHPQHEVMCEIAKWLLPIMGRGGGQDLATIRQKVELATPYLAVLDVVLGPLSKARAKATFELTDAALVLAIRDFEEDSIDVATLKTRLKVYKEKITEALHVFQVLGVQTNFEKMMAISLGKMEEQSEHMLDQLEEGDFE